MWQKYKEWLAVLIFMSMLVVCTTWYLLLNQQQIPVFLTATIVALGFVGIMILLPKYRQQLVKRIVAYHARSKEQRGLYRYQKLALAITTTCILIYSIAMALLPSQYIPYFVVTFLIVLLTAGSVVIAGFLKTAGKWGYLVLLASIIISVIAVLLHHFSKG
jgi:cytochrome b561